jgi:hypothetical protein
MARILHIAMLCLVVAGCDGTNRIFWAGERCDPLWDRIGYKKCYEDSLKAPPQTPVRPEEEKSPEGRFGACSSEDLANHTCR